MADVIKLKRSVTAGNKPSALVVGEFGINHADRKLYLLGPDGSTIEDVLALWASRDTGGDFAGIKSYTAALTLTSVTNGSYLNLLGGAAAYTATLAAANSYSVGDTVYLQNGDSGTANIKTIALTSGDTIVYNGASVTTFALYPGQGVEFTSDAANKWYVSKYLVPSGTNPGNQVALDTSGRLPAVDGSLLTGISASSTPAEDLLFFGDGADGNVTISTTVTLTRTMYYNNLTISGSGVLISNGFRVFVNGVLDISAAGANAISASPPTLTGNSGSGATAGATLTAALGDGQAPFGSNSPAGGAGGTGAGAAGGSAASFNILLAGTPLAGAIGGAGTNAGGAGGSVNTSTVFPIPRRPITEIRSATILATTTIVVPYVGPTAPGGGAGGGDGTNSGGGGGGGGPIPPALFIAARTINRGASTAAGAISAKGTNGGSGGNSTAGNTGGGAGGSGSSGTLLWLIYRFLTGAAATAAINITGGSGGKGGNGLGTGKGGGGGSAGPAGRSMMFNLATGALTDTTGYTAAPAVAAIAASSTTTGSAGAVATAALVTI